jgi:uncharacterized repeat protein (TIGR01451 family)
MVMSVNRSVIVVSLLMVAAAAVASADQPASSQLGWASGLGEKPVGNVVPPAPDPNIILQGGDTCASATVVGGLPYTDSGTTVGYTDDYDEVCPYSGSLSPDVVYVYTPAANTAVDVTLCTGTTNYDTKLYVYQGSCPGGGAVACNDDECTSPLFPSPYVSALTGVPLTGGQTYYFVVDGYGSDSGPYTIEITEWQPPPPPPECDGPDLLAYHTPDGPADPWNAFTSGQTPSFNYTVYDNFDSNMFSITDFHWWGLSLFWTGSGWSACDPTGMTFDVTFHPNSGGQPGAALCTFAGLSPTAVNTGLSYSGYTLYYWEVAGLTPACQPTGATWVGVHSYPNAGGCALLWMSGTGGDAACLQFDGSAYTAQAYDVALCITGSAGSQGDADIEVTKTAQTTSPTTGVYTIRVENLGPDDATGVIVTDLLPAGVSYVSDTCGGTPGAPWTWNVGALTAGDFEVCNITVDILDPANTVNVANAVATQNDPNTGNNASTTQLPPFGGPIPTLSTAGILVLIALVAGVGLFLMRRHF